MKEKENVYETDGIPGAGKRFPDGTYWTQCSGVRVGEKTQAGPGNGWSRRYEWECLEVSQFGSHTYARWIQRVV